MNILIVDDNEDAGIMLDQLLTANGYSCRIATNGREALEAAIESAPDMFISDILMPEMDGYQLCMKVKQDDRLKDIPFVFYTATYLDDKDEELAMSMGADGFIRKPVEMDELLGVVHAAVTAAKAGKMTPNKPSLKEETEILKLYSERLVNKLEKKMLDLEKEIGERKQTETALRMSEERLRYLWDEALDGIGVADAGTGIIVDCNNTLADMVGRDKSELIGEHQRIIHPPEDDRADVSETFDAHRTDGNGELLGAKLLTKDGAQKEV